MRNFYLIMAMFLMTTMSQAQIEMVKEINSAGDASGSASPGEIFVYNNEIYFKANHVTDTEDLGFELYKTDGTETGTVLIKDIRTGADNGSPSAFFSYNNELYFSANEGFGLELWKTDGTEAGTVKTTITHMVYNPLVYNNLVFHVNTMDGNRLYQFDGTDAQPVANAGSAVENVLGGNFIEYNGKLLLYMRTDVDDPTIGTELYEYDFSSTEFSLIKDIDAGTGDASISEFTELSNKVYFEADSYLWETDGTTDGTVAVAAAADISSVRSFYAWNGKLFFEGDDGNGDQLWVYDPAAGTTTNISNISGANTNHDPSDFVEYDGFLYYRGEDGDDTSGHLWRTDGTNVYQLDNTIADVDDIVLLNGFLYFEGDNGVNGNELYKYDLSQVPTSVEKISKSNTENIMVYPSPSRHVINIQGLQPGNYHYEIFDMTGRSVKNGEMTTNRIDHNLGAGIYLLVLNGKDANKVIKITVE